MNPLRVDNKPGSDTRYLVRSALIFMSEAFAALENSGDVLSTGCMTGAAQLMNVCIDALREEEKAEASHCGERADQLMCAGTVTGSPDGG